MFIATIAVSVFLALAVFGSAMAKLTKQPKLVESMTALQIPFGWLPWLAAAEIAGAIGLIVGLWVAPIGIAAAIGLVGYFVGAVATHVRANDKNLVAPGVLLVLSIAALVLRLVTM